jgi:hypothetical protein
MATCTAGATTAADTSNTTSYALGSFTPALNDLLVILVATAGSIEPTAAGACTDDRGGTYYKANFATRSGAASSIYAFVRNQLVASAVGHVVTFTCTGDAATGACILPYRVSGMTRAGSSAVRQSAQTTGIAAGGTPAATFSVACLTGNPVICVLGSAANPAAVTPPSGFTEPSSPSFDIGVGTPAQGIEGCHIDSGFTSTTVTWGSTTGGAAGVVVVELDTSLPAIGGRQPVKLVTKQSIQRASLW